MARADTVVLIETRDLKLNERGVRIFRIAGKGYCDINDGVLPAVIGVGKSRSVQEHARDKQRPGEPSSCVKDRLVNTTSGLNEWDGIKGIQL